MSLSTQKILKNVNINPIVVRNYHLNIDMESEVDEGGRGDSTI